MNVIEPLNQNNKQDTTKETVSDEKEKEQNVETKIENAITIMESSTNEFKKLKPNSDEFRTQKTALLKQIGATIKNSNDPMQIDADVIVECNNPHIFTGDKERFDQHFFYHLRESIRRDYVIPRLKELFESGEEEQAKDGLNQIINTSQDPLSRLGRIQHDYEKLFGKGSFEGEYLNLNEIDEFSEEITSPGEFKQALYSGRLEDAENWLTNAKADWKSVIPGIKDEGARKKFYRDRENELLLFMRNKIDKRLALIEKTSDFNLLLEIDPELAHQWLNFIKDNREKHFQYDNRWIDHREVDIFRKFRDGKDLVNAKKIALESINEKSKDGRMKNLKHVFGAEEYENS